MSAVQVMSYSDGGLAADRTPFFGLKAPPEVKRLAQLCKGIEQATFRKILRGEQGAGGNIMGANYVYSRAKKSSGLVLR